MVRSPLLARATLTSTMTAAAALAATPPGMSQQSMSYATGEVYAPGTKAQTDSSSRDKHSGGSSQFVVKVQITPRAHAEPAHFMRGAMIYDATRETKDASDARPRRLTINETPRRRLDASAAVASIHTHACVPRSSPPL